MLCLNHTGLLMYAVMNGQGENILKILLVILILDPFTFLIDNSTIIVHGTRRGLFEHMTKF